MTYRPVCYGKTNKHSIYCLIKEYLLLEKNTNHDHQEELTQNSYSQDYIKLTAQQQLLLKHPELNSNNIEQNNNLAQSFKHKSLAATTNNNKLTNSNPALAVLNSNQQAKNGIYPFPFVMVSLNLFLRKLESNISLL